MGRWLRVTQVFVPAAVRSVFVKVEIEGSLAQSLAYCCATIAKSAARGIAECPLVKKVNVLVGRGMPACALQGFSDDLFGRVG